MTEEQLVLEGRKLKILCAKRQVEAAGQSGIIIDTLRFTVPQRRLLEQERLGDDFDAGDLEPAQIAHYFAQAFAQLLGFQLGERKNGRDYYESSWTIKNAQDCEMASVSAGGVSGTILFSLKGQGCTCAKKGWELAVHEYFEHAALKITRIDLARDFFDGEVAIEDVVAQYRNHEFIHAVPLVANAGQRPRCLRQCHRRAHHHKEGLTWHCPLLALSVVCFCRWPAALFCAS